MNLSEDALYNVRDAAELRPGLLYGRALWVFTAKEASEFADRCRLEEIAEKHALGPAPFATDACGDLWWFYKDGTIGRVATETFEPTYSYANIEIWAKELDADQENELGTSLLVRWETENGTLAAGHRLMPKIPIVFGGAYDVENFYSIPIIEMLEFRRELASKLDGMPDGAKIWIDTEDETSG